MAVMWVLSGCGIYFALSVRKASVFCLVGIYMIVGEPLRPHLSDLNGSKVGIIRLWYYFALSVCKASVFCLVGIYMIVGEPLRPHLSDLNGSKVGIIRLWYLFCSKCT